MPDAAAPALSITEGIVLPFASAPGHCTAWTQLEITGRGVKGIMSNLTPEEQEAIKDAPKGTFALMILLAVALAGGWAYMFFFMFVQHGPVS